MQSSCSVITQSFEMLLKELRARFLISGDWDGQSPKHRERISAALGEIQILTKKAVTQFGIIVKDVEAIIGCGANEEEDVEPKVIENEGGRSAEK